MPVPTEYTEDELKAYLHSVLNRSGLADMLGWSVAGGSYDEIVTDTLLAYGVSSITSATNISKLRALAVLALWQTAETAVVSEINYTADGATFNREAIFQHITRMLERARVDAFAYTDDYQVQVYGVQRDYDPYNEIDYDLLESDS